MCQIVSSHPPDVLKDMFYFCIFPLLLVATNPPTPTSVLVSVASCRVRALLDTGASACLIKDSVYRSLLASPKLLPAKVTLQTVTAPSMRVIG